MKEIEGFEGYKISETGVIVGFRKYKKGKIIYQGKNIHGYMAIGLFRNGKRTKYTVHRLVALTYIPNPENKKCVNHKNGNKTDNNIQNLEWCTHKENSRHAHDTGLKKGHSARKGCINEENGKSRQIKQLDLQGRLLKIWPSLQQVNRELNFHHGNTGACARGKLATAYGFKWSY